MCVIVDINTMSAVFEEKNVFHSQFAPIKAWIWKGKTKLICGGSKYKQELRRSHEYLRFIKLLQDRRQIVFEDDAKVDKKELQVRALESSSDFDDPHIVALSAISGCKVLCTNDNGLIRFAKEGRFYSRGQQPPFIFTQRTRHSDLKYSLLTPSCRPCGRT